MMITPPVAEVKEDDADGFCALDIQPNAPSFRGGVITLAAKPTAEEAAQPKWKSFRHQLAVENHLREIGVLPDSVRSGEHMATLKYEQSSTRYFFEFHFSPGHVTRFMEIFAHEPDINAPPPSRLDIIQGPCLFGQKMAMAVDGSGERHDLASPVMNLSAPLEYVDINQDVSLYEFEAFMNIGGMLNGLLQTSGKIGKFLLQLPSLQYFLSLADAYADHMIPSGVYTEFMDAINNRKGSFQKAYGEICRKHGVEMDVVDSTIELEAYIYGAVALGNPIDFQRGLEIIREYHPLYARIIDEIQAVRWSDILYAAYLYDFLRLGQMRDETGQLSRALIQADYFIESTIMIRAVKLARKFNMDHQLRMYGLYPFQQFYRKNGDSDFFRYPEALSPSVMAQIVNIYRADNERDILMRNWNRPQEGEL